jgi:hypothetical protein
VVVGCKRSRDEVRDPSEVPFHAQQSPMPSEKPELDPSNSFLPLFLLPPCPPTSTADMQSRACRLMYDSGPWKHPTPGGCSQFDIKFNRDGTGKVDILF